MRLYLGLVHFPVYNKNRRAIASAVTTFDLHDLSRLAKTYGAKGLFIVTPLKDQQELVKRVIRHWEEGFGSEYNPDRKEALALATISESIGSSMEQIEGREGERPLLIATAASFRNGKPISYPEASGLLTEGKVVFLVFGTAWGLTQEVIENSDFVLDPILGRTGYNHLSVRAAAAIILDRLTGSYGNSPQVRAPGHEPSVR
ncbi:MAG: RNA methyltransferase [Deltaproteobacteria bacterium]|nr:RNA methyltransferase [Deltaproteobacteria bacterium]MBW2016729.1 RNA methyltransferase [Deltaproteobacteria bacterium]